MLTRLWAWMGRHRWRIFLAVLWSPVAYIFLFAFLTPVHIWYYREFPFSELAVQLFAEPGEDTLMFRYRLGDRLLYVRSDMAEPAQYWGWETVVCNPLWGECKVWPLQITLKYDKEKNIMCIGSRNKCNIGMNVPYEGTAKFLIYPDYFSKHDDSLFEAVCVSKDEKFLYGRFRTYYFDRAYGRRGTLCPLIQTNGVLDTLLQAMETGNYEYFPYTRRTGSAD